ncbi:MAG: GNAT family N-acetyltransferase [Treponema sp.]|nr:GNAT family N-acetyltransferase [Treponema sp.]
MEILEVIENKEQYMDLLLLADEQESMIMKYLNRGVLFALYDDYDLKTVAVVTKENEDTYEIKNIATLKIYQSKGYGRKMIKHIIQYCEKKCKSLIVGTGEIEKALLFYEKCGFTFSHTVEDFFIKNYDHKIFDNGIQLKDMIYYKYKFS